MFWPACRDGCFLLLFSDKGHVLVQLSDPRVNLSLLGLFLASMQRLLVGFVFLCILPWASLTGLTFTKLVSRESRIEITNETDINLVLDLFEIRNNISYEKIYTISSLTGGLTRIWSGRIYIGEPTDGCGLNNIDNGEFDPDRSILMLEFWKDDITFPEYTTSNCNLPKASLEATSKGWKNLMFSCPGPLCTVTDNLGWSMLTYNQQLQGTLIYYFYREVYDAIVLLNKDYEVYVRIEPVWLYNFVASDPGVLIFMWIFVFFGLLCFSFCIYKYVLYWRVKGCVINHTTISYYCSMMACISFVAFDILLWSFMYTLIPYYSIWGCLAFGFTFVGSANFSLSMWWSGFLFPSHQKRFHSKVLLAVIISVFLAIAFVKFILERFREGTVNYALSTAGLVALFIVSIYTVIIGFIVTVKFIYAKPGVENAHIKNLKRKEANQLMILLLGTGFCVLALLFMSVIFPNLEGSSSSWFKFISQYYFPAFFGLINIFLMTLLHNNKNRDGKTSIRMGSSSVMAGSSGEVESTMSSYTTR